MYISIFMALAIMGVFMKTDHVQATSTIWAVLIGLTVLTGEGISLYLLMIPATYFIGWGIFSLAVYWEDSILLRLFALVLAMLLIIFSFGGF